MVDYCKTIHNDILKRRANRDTKMVSKCIEHNIPITAAAVVCLTHQSNLYLTK